MMATTPLPIEPEIEITPAMIEAGRDVILRFWGELAAEPSFPLCDEVVSSIYATMEASRRSVTRPALPPGKDGHER